MHPEEKISMRPSSVCNIVYTVTQMSVDCVEQEDTCESTIGCAKEEVTIHDITVNDNDANHPILPDLPENAVLREDRNRELRSMLLSVHPCPPLPQIALGDLYKQDKVFSSHDFLATAIDRMLVKQDATFDAERRTKQHALITQHFEKLRSLFHGHTETVEKPDETVEKPDETVEKPDETVEKPDETVEKPEDKFCDPTNATDLFGCHNHVETRSVATSTIAGVLPPISKLSVMDDTETNKEETVSVMDNETKDKTLSAMDNENKDETVVQRLPAFDKLSNMATTPTTVFAQRIYDCFTDFSRQHAIVYFLECDSHNIDIRYKDLDFVCKGDPVHLAACSHLRAYRICRNTEPTSPTEFNDLCYADVLVAFAKEVVRPDELD
jgi:hypothetical protein